MKINSDGIIRADIMTARIEDKNLLTKKGDIYVGTGATTSYDGTDVYQTKAMNIQAAITEDVQREKGSHSLNLGAGTFNGVNAISLGYNANVSADGAISLGYNANVSAANAVQIGAGTNNVANSLQFRDRVVVDGNKKIFGDAVDAKEISSFADMMFFDVTGNEISNKELMDGIRIVQDIIERGQKQVEEVEQTPLIQFNQQNNSVNIGEDSTRLSKESRDRVKNAVLSLLSGLNKPVPVDTSVEDPIATDLTETEDTRDVTDD